MFHILLIGQPINIHIYIDCGEYTITLPCFTHGDVLNINPLAIYINCDEQI